MGTIKIRITEVGVTNGGKAIAVGTVLDVEEQSAKTLVEVNQKAEYLDGETAANVTPPAGTKDDKQDAVKQAKALDNQYKKDELAEAAKAVGVEFSFDATKAVIIEAVIAAGKAEALLK